MYCEQGAISRLLFYLQHADREFRVLAQEQKPCTNSSETTSKSLNFLNV